MDKIMYFIISVDKSMSILPLFMSYLFVLLCKYLEIGILWGALQKYLFNMFHHFSTWTKQHITDNFKTLFFLYLICFFSGSSQAIRFLMNNNNDFKFGPCLQHPVSILTPYWHFSCYNLFVLLCKYLEVGTLWSALQEY